MFKNTYQSGLLSIFYSCGSAPLALWDMEVHNGHIKRVTDHEVNSLVLEIVSTNVAVTFMTCPKSNQTLGIKLPFLVMIVKNLKRYFSFEITILDDKNMRRRFKISNFQSTTKIKPFCTTMPIGLAGGWNQIQFNLSDFTRRAYGSQYVETLRVQVNANVRIRRIYFSDRLYTEEELPKDYKLYLPLAKREKKEKKEVSKPDSQKKPEKTVVKDKVSPAKTPEPEAEPDTETAKETTDIPESGGEDFKEQETGEAKEDEKPEEVLDEAEEVADKQSAQSVSAKPSGEFVSTKGSVDEGAQMDDALDATTDGTALSEAVTDLPHDGEEAFW